MTPRLLELLNHIKDNNWVTTKELAELMGVKQKTIKFHVTNLHKHFGVKRRRDLLGIIGFSIRKENPLPMGKT